MSVRLRVKNVWAATLAGATLAGWFLLPGALAQTRPTHREELPDVDRRPGVTSGAHGVRALPQAAVAGLRGRLAGAEVSWDGRLGTAKFVRAHGGFLTGRNGEGRGVSAEAAAGIPVDDPHRGVKAFLNEHAGLFGFDASALAGARVLRESVGAHNGLRTVVWQQEWDGLPVFEGVLIGNLTAQGELVSVASGFVPGVAAGVANGAQGVPALPVGEAIVRAAASLGDALSAGEVTGGTAVAGDGYGVYEVGGRKVYARRVWLPLDGATVRLCWEVFLPQQTTRERFQVLVDGESGEVWVRRSWTFYISDATYTIFPSDSPSPFTPGWPTPNTGQPGLTSRVTVTLSALDTTASPNGWINDGDNETRGNNTDCFPDRDFDNQPDGGARPQGNPPRVFDFPLDLAQDPVAYTNAATVQMFYRMNWYHDRLYQLGFTESAGNFQEDNFGRGGLGSDSIIGYVQAGADVGYADNAFFMPAPDGINGQIAMFVWSAPTPQRDGDLDSEVIIHEATHGTSTRLVGGGVGMYTHVTRGLGEGWSDFYPLALLAEAGDDPNASYPMGGYVTYRFSGLTENYYFGIRRYPYSTDLAKNPLTFKDIDPNQIDAHAGVPRNPIYGPFNRSEANDIYLMGQLWATMLWEVRANLIAKHGFAVGSELTLQLVTDGMKLCPANPNFIEARDGIILADLVNHGGANAGELWLGFAKRGLGFSASAPDSTSNVGVVEAYDAPGLNVQGTVLSGGNGNGLVDVNECNELQIVLANFNPFPITGLRVTLTTATPGVGFGNRSSDYAELPPLGLGTNLIPFTLSTTPTFICGRPIVLEALIKSDQTTRTNVIVLNTGAVGEAVRFDSAAPVAIPDGNSAGTNSIIVVSNLTSALRDVTVSLHLTHTWVSDLRLELVAPDGTTVVLADGRGGSGDNFGIGCAPETRRTTFDDDAALPISGGFPPFLGAFRPEQPLAQLVGRFGTNLNGEWKLHVVDEWAQDEGIIQCWSLFLSPAQCEDGGGTCPGVDLGIGMTGLPEPVFIGSNLVYTISVTNFGPSAATNVVVNHTLPGSVVFVSATSSQGSCQQVGGTVVCNLGVMPFAQVATITVRVTPTTPGTISSTAVVSAKETDIDLSNNSVTVVSHVSPPAAELALGLADAPDPALVGGVLTYTVSVTNNGPSTASFVTVTNTLPFSVNVLGATVSQGFATIFGNQVVCTFGSLAAGGRATGTMEVTPTAQGTIVASASVAALQLDPIPANNVATAVTTVGPAADLAVTLADAPDPVVVGSNWLYTVTVTNRGPNAASAVALNVTLPAGVTLVSSNATQGALSRAGNTVIGNLGGLGSGHGAVITLVVNSVNSGVFNANATASAAEADPQPANNTAAASTTVAPPNVTIVAAGATLTAESFAPANGTVDVGETVTVLLRLRNAGNVNNTNLVATLLAGGGVVSPSGAQNYGVLPGGGLPAGRAFTFTAAGTNGGTVEATVQLEDGPNALGTVTFTFALPRSQTFGNTAPIVIPDSGAASVYPSTINVSGVTGLVGRVTVTLSNVTHTFTEDLDMLVARVGGPKAVVWSDAGSPAGIANANVTLDDAASDVLPDDGQILAGSYRPADYEPGDAFNAPAPAGPYAAALSVFAGENPNGVWELYVMDDSAGDAGSIAGGWSVTIYTLTPVNQLVDVGLSAVATPSPALVADGITYTFTLTNLGPNTASGVVFTNVLPAGATLVSATASQGVTMTNGGTVVASVGSLNVGAAATVTVIATPGSTGSLTNTATVAASENDLNPANNIASAVTQVGLPAADVGVVQTAPDSVIVGSNMTFTITVTNLGPQTALNVVVTDPLPAGLSFVSAASSVGSATNAANTVTAALGNLNAGGSASITVVASALNVGARTNTVSVVTASSDTNAVNNASSVTLAVTAPAPFIEAAGAAMVAESFTPANFAIENGETVTVALALQNTGLVDTAPVVATLQAAGGVASPSGPQNYGVLARGGAAVSRSFTFTAAPPGGNGVVTATLQLQDGVNPLGAVTFTFPLTATTTFTNAAPITIPDRGGATPYPSSIAVSGLTGLVSRVTVALDGLTHAFPDDVDVLLVGPGGQKVMILSDAGGGHPVTNAVLTLDDAAAAPLPNSARLNSGAYQPADYEPGDAFPPPAPLGAAATAFSTFAGTDPNGTWALYVVDDATGDAGSIGQGWRLTLTTVNPLNPVADLEITLAGAPDPLYVGNPLVYTLSVTNRGPSPASGVTVTDTLAPGLNYVSSFSSQGSIGVVGSVVTGNLGNLAPGAGAVLTIQTVPAFGGSFTNAASVAANESDPNLANNLAQVSTLVIVPAPAQFTEISVTNGLIQALLTGEPGLTYVIEASTNLTDWSPVATNVMPAGGSYKFSDADAPNFGFRFYRGVLQWP